MIRNILDHSYYLLPLTSDEVKFIKTDNTITLYLSGLTKKIHIVVPALEKYGFGNMEKSVKAIEKWSFYEDDKEILEKISNGRPIYKLTCKNPDDVEVTTLDDDTSFLNSITWFYSNDKNNSEAYPKIKKR